MSMKLLSIDGVQESIRLRAKKWHDHERLLRASSANAVPSTASRPASASSPMFISAKTTFHNCNTISCAATHRESASLLVKTKCAL